MESMKEIVERRLQHEGLRSVIPDVEDCKLRLVYEQNDQLLEWLLVEKVNRHAGYLIEHQADQMTILSDRSAIEQCMSVELNRQALGKIADVFFNSMKIREWQQPSMKPCKGVKAFQTYLELFPSLKDNDKALTLIRMEREEAEFIVMLFERVRSFYEPTSDQKDSILRRKAERFRSDACIALLQDLHTAFPIMQKVAKLPFHMAHQLGSQKVRLMTGISWRWMHWQVYTHWHDDYFYLFDRWKSNPNNYDVMQQTLLESVRPIVARLFPNEMIVSEQTFSCEHEPFRFQEGGRNA
jgi:hypothetical protein